MEELWRTGDGGAEGVRTPDLLNAIQALYQLSYDPIRSGSEGIGPGQIVKSKILKCRVVFKTGLLCASKTGLGF